MLVKSLGWISSCGTLEVWYWRGSWRWILWRRIRDGNHGALRFSRIVTREWTIHGCVALDRELCRRECYIGKCYNFRWSRSGSSGGRGFCRCFSSASSSNGQTGVWGNLNSLRCVYVTSLTPLSLKSWTWKPSLLVRALKDFRQAAWQIASCRKSTFTPSSVCTCFYLFLLCFV